MSSLRLSKGALLSVGCVIPARNEEKYLARTLEFLYKQTIKPKIVVVVNDGSVDNTAYVAERYGCVVVNLPFHRESWLGRPELASVLNAGLKVLRSHDIDYVLILGADTLLPSNYIEKLITYMERNKKVVIGSGRIFGERYRASFPRGSGRLVNASWWRELNNMKYPIIWGWESWLVFKAIQQGYEAKCFKDLIMFSQRKTKLSPLKAKYMGMAMKSLGYWMPFALARCFRASIKSPKLGLYMLAGYFSKVNRADIASFVPEYQRKMLLQRITSLILWKN
ncbi:MAG: hypothetical protein DRN04_14540 [Thermoprotei archaeon]|nr:MAG: hypothetical protein DRN04_14540 [Thermoprotei archaeon]